MSALDRFSQLDAPVPHNNAYWTPDNTLVQAAQNQLDDIAIFIQKLDSRTGKQVLDSRDNITKSIEYLRYQAATNPALTALANQMEQQLNKLGGPLKLPDIRIPESSSNPCSFILPTMIVVAAIAIAVLTSSF